MVAVLKPDNKMTPQEDLDWEEKQPIKYEYMNGRVFAMTGGTLPHMERSPFFILNKCIVGAKTFTEKFDQLPIYDFYC
jgi:Uma2 family endonuclease